MSDEKETTEEDNKTEQPAETTPTEENVAFSEDDATTLAMDSDSERLQAEISELKDSLLRSQAELENFRRRSQKESIDAMKYQDLAMIRDILPGH